MAKEKTRLRAVKPLAADDATTEQLAAEVPKPAALAEAPAPRDFVPSGAKLWLPTEAGRRLAIVTATTHAGGKWEWATEAQIADYQERLRVHQERILAERKQVALWVGVERLVLGIGVAAAHQVANGLGYDVDSWEAVAAHTPMSPDERVEARRLTSEHPLPVIPAAVVPPPPRPSLLMRLLGAC